MAMYEENAAYRAHLAWLQQMRVLEMEHVQNGGAGSIHEANPDVPPPVKRQHAFDTQAAFLDAGPVAAAPPAPQPTGDDDE